MQTLFSTFILSVLAVLTVAPFNLQGQTPTQFQSGDWSILCNNTCQASQLLLSENKKLKYSATMSKTGQQDLLQMKLVFPLGIYLPANIALMISETEKTIPVVTCVPSGCNALLVLNTEIQNAMLEASFFKVRFFSTDNRENELVYSLKGFKEAIAIVK